MALLPLFAESEMAFGEKRAVKVAGKRIFVCRLEDGYFALQNTCTHVFAPLHKGKIIDECRIQCPFHHAQFNIRTGEVVNWACFPPGIQLLDAGRKEQPLASYPVSIVDGQVCVEID